MGNRWWQNGHAAMFEVKFGQKTERATAESRERSAEQLFDTLEPVALAVEGSDLGASEDCFEPTASCINDTKKRQLVTRSGPDWDAVSAISTTSGRWIHLLMFENSSEQCLNRCVTSRLVSGDANAAAYKYYEKQEYQDLHNSSVAIMLREMRREVNMGLPFENKLHIDYSTNNHPTQLHAADDLDCCFMAILSWRKPAWARFTRKLSSDLKQNHAVTSREQLPELRERTNYPRRKRTEEISRERRIRAQLRATAQPAHRDQEDATDPMVAPQDYDVHQSVRVLELQNSDPWLRPTDRSSHFPILMTIREEPFKNNRSRTSEKWKAKFEEAKKQKIKKNDDGRSNANWQKSSWSWHQPMTWTSSSWQHWCSKKKRKHSDWKTSAGWSSPDWTRERNHQVPGSHRSHDRDEWVLHLWKHFQGSMTTKITSSWPRRQKRSKTETIPCSFLGFLSSVNCISPRTVSAERTYQQPHGALDLHVETSAAWTRTDHGSLMEPLSLHKGFWLHVGIAHP